MKPFSKGTILVGIILFIMTPCISAQEISQEELRLVVSFLKDARDSTQEISLEEMSGKELFEAAGCSSCHASDGTGKGTDLFLPVRDFTDCRFARREPLADWFEVVKYGGPRLGLSDAMPAYSDSLSDEQIMKILDHVAGFCTDYSYPPGELNFPRAFFTEKAFPEDEMIFLPVYTKNEEGWRSDIFMIWEKRIGPRSQFELNLPWRINRVGSDTDAGLRFVDIGFKHVLWYSAEKASIVSAGFDVALNANFGEVARDTTVLEPFMAWSQGIGKDFFLHSYFKWEEPVDKDVASREFLLNFAVGKPLGPWVRSPVLILETNMTFIDQGSYEVQTWITPLIHKPLVFGGFGALLGAAGVRIPINIDNASYGIVGYLLYEYIWSW